MSINKFGVGDRKKLVKFTEYSIKRQIETVLRAKHFLHSVGDTYNVQNKRITHLEEPKDPHDSTNKSYVDRQLGHIRDFVQSNVPENFVTFNRVKLKLSSKRVVGGFFVIESYDSVFYEFYYTRKVGILFKDFLESQVEIYLDDIRVGEPYLSNKNSFIDVSAWKKRDQISIHVEGVRLPDPTESLLEISSTSKIAFKKVGEVTKPHLHCELVLLTKIDREEKYL